MVKAIKLAFELEYHRAYEAAAELRRLHEINQELQQALKALQHSLDYEDLLHDDQRSAYRKALELIEKQEEPNV